MINLTKFTHFSACVLIAIISYYYCFNFNFDIISLSISFLVSFWIFSFIINKFKYSNIFIIRFSYLQIVLLNICLLIVGLGSIALSSILEINHLMIYCLPETESGTGTATATFTATFINSAWENQLTSPLENLLVYNYVLNILILILVILLLIIIFNRFILKSNLNILTSLFNKYMPNKINIYWKKYINYSKDWSDKSLLFCFIFISFSLIFTLCINLVLASELLVNIEEYIEVYNYLHPKN